MAEYTKAKKIPKVKKQQIIDIIKQFAKTILRIVLFVSSFKSNLLAF